MKINNIKLKNYKTYRELKLDLSVVDGKSIVLIGGGNGQGKTTLFEAICGALYGLDIQDEKMFKDLMSLSLQASDPKGWRQQPIELQIEFSGYLNGQERTYTMYRRYQLNNNKVAWAVKLSFDNNEYVYGTHTSVDERRVAEQMVNKIIKANLPKDLSNYFFFDAGKTGERVDGAQINEVVKKCLLSAMGFQKFHDLKSMAQSALNAEIASRQKDNELRKEFEALIEEGRKLKLRRDEVNLEYENALLFCKQNKEEYDLKRQGIDANSQLEKKINLLQAEIEETQKYEKKHVENIASYSRTLDNSAALPRMAEMLRSEVLSILNAKQNVAEQNGGRLSRKQIDAVAATVADVLMAQYQFFQQNHPDAKTLAERIWQQQIDKAEVQDVYHYLDDEDVAALKQMIDSRYSNNFPQLDDERKRLDNQVRLIAGKTAQIAEYKRQLAGGDATLIEEYEQNENKYKRLYTILQKLDDEIKDNEKECSKYDVPNPQGDTPYYKMLKVLPDFFAEVESKLIERRSKDFEDYVCERVNRLIYNDTIVGRVSLGFERGDVSFKLYHVQGNEIPLSQLSTAQKQILMQVLLDATNRLGDYQPPIVIDTILGNVDRQHRQLLINQYPELSQQTILFSNDEEITIQDGLEQLRTSIAKVYTLNRDHMLQTTTVENHYFGATLNE